MEVVAGDYNGRVEEQINAYVNQLSRNSDLKGVILVVIENKCLQKLKEKIADQGW